MDVDLDSFRDRVASARTLSEEAARASVFASINPPAGPTTTDHDEAAHEEYEEGYRPDTWLV